MARVGPSPGAGVTDRKKILYFDRQLLLSEKFKGARPFGVPYKNPSPEFREANERLAKQVAEDIVEVLEERIRETGRPQKTTQALVEALLDPRNRSSDATGFTVGIDSFLEESKAGRYFRNLEYGSNVFVGRIIEGFFAGANGRPIEPGQGRAVAGAKNALRLVQTGNFTNPSHYRKGEEMVPAPAGRYAQRDPYGNPSASSRTEGEFPVRGGGGPDRHTEGLGGNHRGPSRPIVIHNPIPRYAYFEQGIRHFQQRSGGPGGLIAEEYRRAARVFIERGGLVIH